MQHILVTNKKIMSIKIIFFNHKGGVSKTTTTYNIGWMLADKGKKVLLVDADPQCNLSALILGDDFEKYYFDQATADQNIKDGVKVAFEAKPEPIKPVKCIQVQRNESLYLLAGHANLSEYDAALSFAQTSNNAITTLQNLPGAFNELIERTSEQYNIDFVLIDLNPGLSAINQNLFISSDAFIIPTNPDPFSIMAINTLKEVLPRWVKWADTVRESFANSAYPISNSRPRFVGEIIQRFNVRRGKAARPYRDNISEIKRIIKDVFVPEIKQANMLFPDDFYKSAKISDDYCLGEIQDFQGLLPKSNLVGVPVFALTDSEINETGPVLEQMQRNRDRFNDDFDKLTNQILNIAEHANSI